MREREWREREERERMERERGWERGRGRGGLKETHDENGWTVVGGRKGKEYDRREMREPRPRDLTHFYFTNFPENFTEKALWRVFQRYDKVWEVYIAPRRDKRGKQFGFVRFMEVKNPAKLERELDSIIIGNMKMHVNIPRFENRKVRKDGMN